MFHFIISVHFKLVTKPNVCFNTRPNNLMIILLLLHMFCYIILPGTGFSLKSCQMKSYKTVYRRNVVEMILSWLGNWRVNLHLVVFAQHQIVEGDRGKMTGHNLNHFPAAPLLTRTMQMHQKYYWRELLLWKANYQVNLHFGPHFFLGHRMLNIHSRPHFKK